MAALTDSGYLAAHLSLPVTTITELLDAPTSDLVKSFLSSVQAKAREFDNLTAGKLRADVELETVVRATQSRNQKAKESGEKNLKEIEELRKALSKEGL